MGNVFLCVLLFKGILMGGISKIMNVGGGYFCWGGGEGLVVLWCIFVERG